MRMNKDKEKNKDSLHFRDLHVVDIVNGIDVKINKGFIIENCC